MTGPTRPVRPAAALILAGSFLALAAPPALAARDGFKIAPGPRAISDEERAIQPDPARGAEHGVILVEETDRNDNLGRWTEISFHQRAKILDNEGRGLADLEIPYDVDADRLSEWWAFAILPDGNVLDVPRSALTEQTIVKLRGLEWTTLKAALPGVVPGTVIDYGYTMRTAEFLPPDTVWLQREWPVRLLRYRWAPYARLASGYLCRRIGGLDVTATVKDGRVLVEAKDIRPVPDEPLMPPRVEANASAVFYYHSSEIDAADYWDAIAIAIELGNGFFLSKAGVVELIERAAAPAGEAVTPKLRAVYDWLEGNVENVTTRSIEAEELAARVKDRSESDTARFVMQKRRATGLQLAQLFTGAARRLGAEAWIALAVDRREAEYNPALLSASQFDDALVAVRAPDGPADRFVFVAPGSGLPYGEVPWWLAGGVVLVATDGGPLPVPVPVTEAAGNAGAVVAQIAFSPEGETASISWTIEGTGQHGYERWLDLRRHKPEEREQELLALCGSGGEIEINEAVAEGLDARRASERIRCRGELLVTNIEPEIERYSFAVQGPWFAPVPDLRPGPRRFPVVLDFPRTEKATLEIDAPPGFEPGPPPPAERLGTAHGSYALTVTRTERGFRVERTLTLPRATIPVDVYPGLAGFFDSVRRADTMALPFVRKAAGS